ncbi:sulfur deprivation response regulator [Halanaerobium saccharolyticum subsp. saccharolyticum DSM 6643]|uniref:Sulfur deprivation response regulator n=1 Tax=Halanaerobium saccharolyticum subsp. saccharolyticum DSM 6643 TaxID=1293054 RepID=M5DXG8_9FIRM|nr:SLC13 family permease [Halanaerobium saccharolyticum]CCU77802.1 sulfur deprivation response regulator [Halanaerobium saccharolyticum subsp. saccharolyticum DSM 6643]
MDFEIALTLIILAATIILFITETFRVDIIAIMVMLTLGWTGLISPAEAFSGLSSNAVIAIIAIMIIGYGMEQSGVMQKITKPLLAVSGKNEKRLTVILSLASGALSGLMQNIGVIALFLPVVRKMTRKLNLSLRKVLMPVGFAVILGGNLTMVGAGNLIILNDLLLQQGSEPFNLFAVFPIGIVVLLFGITYFYIFGGLLLPKAEKKEENFLERQQKLIANWDLSTKAHNYIISEKSMLLNKTLEESKLWADYNLYLLALKENNDISYAPWRFTRFAAGQELIIMGEEADLHNFAEDYNLISKEECEHCLNHRELEDTAFAELMIPPRSELTGKSIRDIAVRKNYFVNPIYLIRGKKEIGDDFSDLTLRPGDTLVVYGPNQNIRNLKKENELILLTALPNKDSEANKPFLAIGSFLLSILLIILGFNLGLAFFTGAVLIILSGIVKPNEIYQAVDWKTVFLLTGLIPLGIAMENTGAASYLANLMIMPLKNGPVFLILLAVALLASIFTLFMSNVAATVVLVPLVMIIGNQMGISPRGLALLAAVSASNSFILPTHQVNAFFMSAGDYKSSDYLKAGSFLSFIYIFIASLIIYLFYI